MPTLLQINVVVNSGSTGRIAEEIGQLAIQQGWESYIAYGRNPRPSKSQLIRIGTDWDIKWHGIQTRLFDRHGLASKKATVHLIEQILELKPNIIHLHNLHGYYLNIEILFKFLRSANIPIVWTLHDCWLMTGHCAYFSFCDCERWKTGCHDCPQKTTYPGSIGLDRSRKNYELKRQLFTSVPNLTIVPVSQWLSDIVSESYLAPYPRKVIYNGIDIDIFDPNQKVSHIREKYHLQNRMVLIGVASIWSERKGLRDFTQLAKRLPPDITLVLVGLKEKQIKELPDNIIGIKRTESVQELAELYNVADLFLNPTWEDNFPTTNLEALACGTPVMTYRTGGSIEAIDEQTGFVVEQGDIDGVMRCIKNVQAKGKVFYNAACRERAVRLYSKEDRYVEYLELYKEIMDAK